MAQSPEWKVYDANGIYKAAFKHIEDAAAMVGIIYGDGATIRHGHGKPLWTEGTEEFPASESYDRVFDVVMARKHAADRVAYFKIYGRYPD